MQNNNKNHVTKCVEKIETGCVHHADLTGRTKAKFRFFRSIFFKFPLSLQISL